MTSLSIKAIFFYNLKDVNNDNYEIMKRRSALQKIAWVSGGIAMLPYYCSTQSEITVYNNLPIAISDRNLINLLSNLILPEDPESFPTMESRLDFVLTRVNDGFDSQEISDYLFGMTAFRRHVTATYGASFEDLVEVDQLACIGKTIDCSDEKSFFVSTIKRHSLRHFTTSENYMKKYLNFEFMPGRYNGCVSV
ncbi:MAG: hypothetical protein C7M88_03195 [Candidatus Arcticimaribacter sp.]|nr:gluconate 2-dehydrogenase subunit 3 family protein [Flavobacteriaceae bacterium]PSR10274.1 MAG: hypothetical protein C7M88_03195 [Candidatus Arcticimaribacter sp.]PTL99040.1 MAG: hypothetical protein DA394_07415 [Candidatus Arcticimaribacter sp.]